MASHQAGNLAEAEHFYKLVLAAKQHQFEALHYLGVLEAQRGRYDEADRLIGSSLEIDAKRPEAFSNHARVLNALKRYEEALTSCNKALSIKPDFAEALIHRGNALQGLNRLEAALANYDAVLKVAPDHILALTNRGNVLCKLNRYAEAVASYTKTLLIRPDQAEAHMNLGVALRALNRRDEAIQKFRQALVLDPGYVEALVNLGAVLHDVDLRDEAVQCLQRALTLDPSHAEAHYNLGNVLMAHDRHHDAVQHYDKALAFRPDFALAKWNKFLSCMALGRLAEGWDLYDSRWTADVGNRSNFRSYERPLWAGEHVGGVLLVWGEQGLGDQILHASMVPDLLQHADSVVVEVEPRLVPLFARSFPDVRVVALGNELYRGRVHAHVPIASLGKYLRPSWDSFGQRAGAYLTADHERAATLRERLAHDKRTVVGLSWRSVNLIAGHSKSVPLKDFESVLRLPGCRFIDLQYGDTLEERQAVEREVGVAVERLADIDNTNDIDGLAALIAACDVVVTVSNTTAHIAGALGKPTWLFVPFGYARIWYWFKGRNDCPWYAQVRLRRQAGAQSWTDLISSTAKEVCAFVESS